MLKCVVQYYKEEAGAPIKQLPKKHTYMIYIQHKIKANMNDASPSHAALSLALALHSRIHFAKNTPKHNRLTMMMMLLLSVTTTHRPTDRTNNKTHGAAPPRLYRTHSRTYALTRVFVFCLPAYLYFVLGHYCGRPLCGVASPDDWAGGGDLGEAPVYTRR